MKKSTKDGAIITRDRKASKPAKAATKKPGSRTTDETPDGNTPVDKQPEESERARLRPIDQA